jgi:hypothetical protein
MIMKLDVSFQVQEYTVSQLRRPQSRCPNFDTFAVLLQEKAGILLLSEKDRLFYTTERAVYIAELCVVGC